MLYLHFNQRFQHLTYTGITSNLKKRVYEHKGKMVEGFTKTYNISKLVYFEAGENAIAAITREKQIKAGSRDSKNKLISGFNPDWKDLYDEI